MGTTVLVSVAEYLSTSFPDGDREYVDGRVVERNVGEVDHSDLQTTIAVFLRGRYKHLWAGVEVRVQVKSTRFRVPDVAVVPGRKPQGKIISAPPLLAIEVLSPDDRAADLQEKIDDFLAFGAAAVWVVDPKSRRGFIHTSAGSHEAKDGVLRSAEFGIELPLPELFDDGSAD
jgi:Uma2 family endonuclease